MSYSFFQGYSDTDDIKYCPRCGKPVDTWTGDGRGICRDCGWDFAVIDTRGAEGE